MGEFVFYAAFVLFILFGPWILVWRGRLRRERERLENDLRWSHLTGRVHALEQAVKKSRRIQRDARGPADAGTPNRGRVAVSVPISGADGSVRESCDTARARDSSFPSGRRGMGR